MSCLLVTAPKALATSKNSSEQKYYLGDAANAGLDTGYSEDNPIDKDDIHYSWELGRFFISDYTRVTDDNGIPVFLKNVGDEITLSFNLEQDINKLNGNENATIDADPNGYDRRLKVPQQDFGQGTLIISYTDYQNNRHKPTIYTNYLDGVKRGADTFVKTFEEGDYEVVLDYSIKNVNHGKVPFTDIEVLPSVTDYTMRFSFKVRNGNCMVYPFDIKTNDELCNTAFTENGFMLDLARSRYLNIDVKKEMLADDGNELVSDTRFNQPARDGEEFTDEGVYTFIVSNDYTGQSTTKMLYVGTDPVLKAHATTGKSVSSINTMLSDGATISDDGTIAKAGQTLADALPIDEDSEPGTNTKDDGSEAANNAKDDSKTSGQRIRKASTPEFPSMDDPELLRYMEDSIYAGLEAELGSDDYGIENVTAVYTPYISDEYKDNLEYNSRTNIYFGYTLNELNQQFQGVRYIFTIDENGKTTVTESKSYDDTYDRAVKNVATGTGVILVCVTVSVATGGVGAAPVCAVFAAAAKTGTIAALSSGVISGCAAGIVKAYETGGDMEAVAKEAALKGSEGFMWGAITGALAGGISEANSLRNASKAAEAAKDSATVAKSVPTPRESEIAALEKFGGNGQLTFLNGKEVAYGTKGATRPDIVRTVGGKLEAIEVKNYDLVNNANGLYSELKREVADRVANLPEGSLQRVVLDIRGRGYDEAVIEAVKQGIWSKLEAIYPNIPIEFMV